MFKIPLFNLLTICVLVRTTIYNQHYWYVIRLNYACTYFVIIYQLINVKLRIYHFPLSKNT